MAARSWPAQTPNRCYFLKYFVRNSQKSCRATLAARMIQDVFCSTGITATGGIGTNLYLCKIAMDIVAKHVEADKDGVRIAELNEISYRRILWSHRPLTDFWRIGRGYSKKLEEHGLYTLGDIARCSLGKPGDYHNEELLYKLFGINAELLIDHAWGWEPCTMADIKAYKPQTNSICSGQVLQYPYESSKAKLVVQEMADQLALDLVDKGLVTKQIELYVGYDIENLTRPEISKGYNGPVITDHYGRRIPKQAHGTANLDRPTSSTKQILNLTAELFDSIVDEKLLVRRLGITANHVTEESSVKRQDSFEQLDMFTDYEAVERRKEQEAQDMEREKRMQNALLDIKKEIR